MNETTRLSGYQLLAEAIPQIIWVSDSAGQAEYFNAQWFAYTGFSYGDSVGSGWHEAIHRDDREAAADSYLVATATGTPYQAEFRLRGTDGSYRWFLARAVPAKNPDETIAQWFGTCTEIEDQKRYESLLLFFARIGRVLGASLDPAIIAEGFVQVFVPDYADFAMILSREGNEFRSLAMTHVDPAGMQLLAEINERYPLDEDDPFIREACELKEAVIHEQISAEMQLERSLTVDHLELIRGLGTRSSIVVPLLARGEVAGLLVAGYVGSPHRYRPVDRALFQEMAHRVAVAIENARRYQREHEVASALQATMLPQSLPEIPGVTLSSTYIPAASELKVGGDWYDAFLLPSGMLGISVGDVTGHGLDAAIVMGEIRQAIRSAAIESSPPSAVLDHADRLLHLNRPEMIATAGFAIYDPVDRTITYATAGHPPPLVARPDGTIVSLHVEGLPLGMRQIGPCGVTHLILEPGTTVCFYTDGLIEFDRDALRGEEILREALAEEVQKRDGASAERIYRTVVHDARHEDDTAILLLQVE